MPFGIGGLWQPEDPNAKYNVKNAGQYGLNAFNPEETRRKQRALMQQQIQQGMQNAQEQALASGSFNPDISSYRATQGARNAMFGADVDLDKYAHEDQYKLLNSMLGVDSAKLNWSQLAEQKRQFDEQQPSWLSGVLDLALGGASMFAEDGGVIPNPYGIPVYPHKIKRSEDYLYDYGGYIPPQEANSPPTPNQPTNDNTLIKAKSGESIMNNEATSLFGADTVNAINNTAKMAGKYFAGGGTIPQPLGGDTVRQVGAMGGMDYSRPAIPTNTMGNGMGNMDWYNPNGNTMNNIGGLMGYGMKKIAGMFAEGGVVDDPQTTAKIAELENNIGVLNAQLRAGTIRPTTPTTFGTTVADYMSQMASQLYRLKGLSSVPANPAIPNTTPMPDSGGGGGQGGQDLNNNGIPDMQERTITIKTKPVTNNKQQGQSSGVYTGTGYTLPPR